MPVAAATSGAIRLLSGREIHSALVGKLVSYSPPGWADAGIHEQFHQGGLWSGIYYSRGPVRFSGRWTIRNDQVCVQPDRGTIVALWFAGDRCRAVWRSNRTGRLFANHLDPRRITPLPLAVTSLKDSGKFR